jgi:hypothetical protein
MLSRHSNRKRAPLPGNSTSRRGIYNPRKEPILLRFPSITRRAKVLLFVLMTSGVFLAGKEFNLPTPHPAPTYPARDQHSDESVTVAVDPYDMPDKAAIFTTNYADEDMLPVYVIITNDGDETITLSGMKAEFITASRTKIAPATQEDLYRRLSHPKGPKARLPIPIPIPAGRPKGTVSTKAVDEMQRAQFSARAVEPHSTQAGFLFFDISGIDNPLPGAHFFLTGLHNAKGDDLYYFEIALEKYLSAPEPEKPHPAEPPAK